MKRESVNWNHFFSTCRDAKEDNEHFARRFSSSGDRLSETNIGTTEAVNGVAQTHAGTSRRPCYCTQRLLRTIRPAVKR